MKYFAFGDSITTGAGASPASNGYIGLLNLEVGQAFENTAASTAMAIDSTAALFGKNSATGDSSVIMFGTNDQAKYGLDVQKRGYYIDAIRAQSVWLGATCFLATPSSVTFTGNWSNGYALSTYGSTSAGSKATFTVTGSAICIGMFRQYNNTSTFNVKIDGVDKGNFNTGGDVRTLLGASYGINGIMFTGLSAGSHSVVITVITASASSVVFFKFFSGMTPKAKVILVNTPYAIAYTYGGSSANVDDYNVALSSLALDLSAQGLDVSLANANSLTASDMADNVHPNNSGHLKIKNLVYAELTGGLPSLTYTQTQAYLGSDGNIYADGASGKIQIN